MADCAADTGGSGRDEGEAGGKLRESQDYVMSLRDALPSQNIQLSRGVHYLTLQSHYLWEDEWCTPSLALTVY